MRGSRHSGTRLCAAAVGAAALLLALSLALSVPATAAGCDEDNPASPARTTQLTLSATDAVNDAHDELRTFVATGSLGRVDFTVVSAVPAGVLRSLTALPQLSRLAAQNSEQLKGIGVRAVLAREARAAKITIRLRQICAEHFRDTFLYE